MKQSTVLALIIAVVLIAIVWDLWLVKDGIGGNTISEVIKASAYKHPIIPFFIGVLIGHWFWS